MSHSEFSKELEHLINKHSIENGSNTPDFMLRDYLMRALESYEIIVHEREKWYGMTNSPGQLLAEAPSDQPTSRPMAGDGHDER